MLMKLKLHQNPGEIRNKLHDLKIAPRGLSRIKAAELAGICVSSFDKARKEGKYPGPTLPGKRYDSVLLQAAMDQLSGIGAHKSDLSPLEAWRLRRDTGPSNGH